MSESLERRIARERATLAARLTREREDALSAKRRLHEDERVRRSTFREVVETLEQSGLTPDLIYGECTTRSISAGRTTSIDYQVVRTGKHARPPVEGWVLPPLPRRGRDGLPHGRSDALLRSGAFVSVHRAVVGSPKRIPDHWRASASTLLFAQDGFF